MTYLFQKSITSRRVFVAVMLLLVTGCAQKQSVNLDSSQQPETVNVNFEAEDVVRREASFFSIYNQWQGVPYRLGGNDKEGIDCSAFVQIAYRDAWQLPLPRTTKSQSKIGENVKYASAQYGDLVFFKTTKTTNHVGVYLGNLRFMHASTSQGVIISRLDNPYWASKFWQFRRIDNVTE
ncbi:MAG: NlpC/P60 family protein [Vibrio sp.]|uniref:NlpC/P60 family protein n=1 Tax=Vibrio sp. TaxID=678 RepID=UPI003A8A6F5B